MADREAGVSDADQVARAYKANAVQETPALLPLASEVFPVPEGVSFGDSVVPEATLPVFTVNAWHFETLDIDHPANITVIDRAAIEAAGAVSLPDLLQREANVRVDSFNGKASQGQLSLRGFGENSGLRTLIVVDGQRINRPDMGGVEWQQVPLSDIERVEVIRGGGNVLYGNYALAGVIQISTRKGGELRTRLSGEVGSDGLSSATLDHAGGRGAWFWDASASYLWDTGYRDNSGSWNKGLSGTVGRFFNREQSQSLSLSAAVSEGYTRYPGPLTFSQFEADPRQSRNAGDEFTEYTTGLLSALWEGEHAWGESQLNASLSFRDLLSNQSGNARNQVLSSNDQYTATLSPSLRFGKGRQFVLGGLDLSFDKLDYDSYLPQDIRVEEAQAELQRLTVGPYLFARRWLREDVSVSGGFRYESATGDYQYRDFLDNQLLPIIQTNRGPLANPFYKNPPELDVATSYDQRITRSGFAGELSLLWKASEFSSFWLGYDRVYRYPVLDETAAYQGFPLSEPVAQNLEPETGNQWEAGFKLRSQRWAVSATLYWLRLDGEIIYDDLRKLNVNYADTERLGAELLLEYAAEQWGASTQWEFVDAEFLTGLSAGKTVPLVPSAHGVSRLWLEPRKGLRATLYHTVSAARYAGNDFANAGQALDAWQRFDLHLSAQARQITLYARINNLLGSSQAPLAYQGGYYPAPERQWRTGFSWAF